LFGSIGFSLTKDIYYVNSSIGPYVVWYALLHGSKYSKTNEIYRSMTWIK